MLFHELISGSSVSSSSVGNNNETLELLVVGEGSDIDGMPELEDETNLDSGRNPFVANTQWGYGNFSKRQSNL